MLHVVPGIRYNYDEIHTNTTERTAHDTIWGVESGWIFQRYFIAQNAITYKTTRVTRGRLKQFFDFRKVLRYCLIQNKSP